MARYWLVRWRGIPSLVEAEDDGGPVRRPLSSRFQELIDAAAVRLGATGTEAYLEGWDRSAACDRPGAAAVVAEAVAAELEADFAGFVARHLPPPT